MFDKKLELLGKAVWTRNDIIQFCEVSPTQATKIKNRAVAEFDGACPYGEAYVKVESVLKLFGTDVTSQVAKLKVLNEG